MLIYGRWLISLSSIKMDLLVPKPLETKENSSLDGLINATLSYPNPPPVNFMQVFTSRQIWKLL